MAGRPARGRFAVYAEVTGLGLEIAVGFGLPTYGGHRLDAWLGTGPVGLLAGLVLGLALGAVLLWRTAKRLEEGR